MKKIYIKKWMIALLLLVLGIAALTYSYLMIYTPAMEEYEAAEKSIQTLQLSIATAKGNLKQAEQYKADTEKVKADTEKLYESVKMPGKILEEDQILFIRDLERTTKQKQAQIVFGTDSQLFSTGGMVLNEKTFPYNYALGYDAFKDLILYLVTNEETPMSLVSLTVAYDAQTDTVSGTMILRRYYVTGLEEYVPPVIPGIIPGADQIFG